MRKAHRVAWSLAHPGRPLRRGDHVCHRCDNRRCIRPSHLFLGTAADNHDDATDKGRIPNHLRATAEEQREALREWTP